ncbi:MAG: AarF/UbiB family protein [Patescibacteria group bacterium]
MEPGTYIEDLAREKFSATFPAENKKPNEYNLESEKISKKRKIELHKNNHKQNMEQTRELLDKDHELYTLLYGILEKLRPNANCELLISLSDIPNASTLKDNKTIIISIGLITKLDVFFRDKKGKGIPEGALAFVLAHELSHWDEAAEVMHINEQYCDVNGFQLAAEHYNTDDLRDVLEYLEWEDDQLMLETGSIAYPSITHSSSEGRRIAIDLINNDPDIHLNGRILQSVEFPQDMLSELTSKSEEWKESTYRRTHLTSQADIKEQLENAQTISEIMEVCIGADRFYHARLAKKLSEHKDMDDLILALAGWMEPKGTATFIHYGEMKLPISSQDMYTQLCSMELSSEEDDVVSTDNNRKVRIRKPPHLGQMLKQKALAGEYQDPLAVLAEGSYLDPQLPKVHDNFNQYFINLVNGVNHYFYPNKDELIHGTRSEGFGFTERLKTDDYVLTGDTSIDQQRIENRKKFLQEYKVAISSCILRLIQGEDDHENNMWKRDDMSLISKKLDQFSAFLPDNDLFCDNIAARLVSSGLCKTQEVAHDIALLMVTTGRYAHNPDAQLLGSFEKAGTFQALTSSEPEIMQDLHDALLSRNVMVTLGGQRDRQLYGESLLSHNQLKLFASSIKDYIDHLESRRRRLNSLEKGSPVDPYKMVLSGNRTIGNPGGLESNGITETLMHKKIAHPYLYETDRGQVKAIMLHIPEDRVSAINAALSNKEILDDRDFLRTVLREGVDDNLLTPQEVRIILDKVSDMDMYREFLPLVADSEDMSEYYKTWWNTYLNEPSNATIPMCTLIANFITIEGGVITTDMLPSFSIEYDEETNVISPHGTYYLNRASGESVIDRYYSYLRGQIEFPFRETDEAANSIVAFCNSKFDNLPNKLRQEVLDVAARMKAYTIYLRIVPVNIEHGGMGLNNFYVDYKNPSHTDTSFKSLLEDILKLPMSRQRDTLLISYLMYKWIPDKTRNLSIDDSLYYHVKSPDIQDWDDQEKVLLFQTAVSHLSQETLKRWDVDNPNHTKERTTGYGINVALGNSAAVTFEPYTSEITDVAESYPFLTDSYLPRHIGNTVAEMLEYTVPDEVDRLSKLEAVIPVACGPRDFIIERTINQLEKNRKSAIISEDDAQFFDKAYNLAASSRTRHLIASRIVPFELSKLSSDSKFSEKLNIVLQYFPEHSTDRDQFLTEILLESYTSWDDLEKVRSLIAGYDLSTNEQDKAIRNMAMEYLAKQIEDLSLDERVQVLDFLLDISRHVVNPSDITPEYFKGKVLDYFKGCIIGFHYTDAQLEMYSSDRSKEQKFEITESYVNDHIDEIISYMISHEELSPLESEVKQVIRRVKPIDLLRLQLPERINDKLSQLCLDKFNEKSQPRSGNSLGPLFFTMSRADRRRVLYNLLLGKNGCFEDEHYNKHGVAVLESIINIATAKILSEDTDDNEEDNISRLTLWSEGEVSRLKQVSQIVFEEMESTDRAEFITRLIEVFIRSGGNPSKEEFISMSLGIFRAVGGKIAQMNELWPPEWRSALSSYQEGLTPMNKLTVYQLLQNSGRHNEYAGIGSALGAATIGSVFEARSIDSLNDNGGVCDTAIKALRVDVLAHLQEDVDRVKRILERLSDEELIDVDPTHLVAELTTVLNREVNTKIEASAAGIMQLIAQQGNFKIAIPEIRGVSRYLIEMTIANGISFGRVAEIQQKKARGESLTLEEERYTSINLQKVSRDYVRFLLHQALGMGLYHTDPHFGNVFISPEQGITQLDHGQIGSAPSAEDRDNLLSYMIGLYLDNHSVISDALHHFAPDIQAEEFNTMLQGKKGEELRRYISEEVLANASIDGSIYQFQKMLITAYPYLENLSRFDIITLAMPYIRSPGVVNSISHIIRSSLPGYTHLKVP